MPGLFGIVAKDPALPDSQLSQHAWRMAAEMRSRPWQSTEVRAQRGFCGGRVHLGVLNPAPQPLCSEDDSKMVWFDGEIYPGSPRQGTTPPAAQVLEWIDTPALLAGVDGVFTGACFDSAHQQLALFSDRLGLRPLYYTETRDWFAYAAEVKALLAILPQTSKLDEISLRQFFGFGHLLGDRTWWQGISLLPPGSIWRLGRTGQRRQRYWSFAQIKRDPIPLPEAEQQFAYAWSRSVRQRTKPGRTALLLSGGLDSRLLLAELSRQGHDITAITFGEPGCSDIQIAKRCASIARVPHRILHITPETWWQHREDAIWQIDGLINGLDLHAAIATEDLRYGNCCNPMNLAGDLLFGGSYLREDLADKEWDPRLLMRDRYIENPFWSREETLESSMGDIEEYCTGPSTDCFYLMQRVRRCTIYGPIAYAHYCETTYPSMAYPLLQLFLGGLTDEQRLHSRFYNRFLCTRYPAYYNDIPWQKTGRGLNESPLTSIRRRAARRLERLMQRPTPSRSFANYSREHYTLGVRDKLSEYGDLLTESCLGGQVSEALAGKKGPLNAATMLAILTLEVYLRQVLGIPKKL